MNRILTNIVFALVVFAMPFFLVLTVTRALIEDGVPASSVFAAAFGAEQPVASNADAAGRAQNRRVEITPTPRPSNKKGAGTS